MKRQMAVMTVAMLAGTAAMAGDVALTVYNTDLAVVKIVDSMHFEKGLQTKTFTDVAKRIDPTSVRLKSRKDGVSVIEQNYRYDLVNSFKILERYLDRNVTLVLKEGDVIEGTLLSTAGDLVLKSAEGGTKIVRQDTVEHFDLPGLAEGLVTRPTLFWELHASRAGDYETEMSYMTGGFSWHAEYTAVVNEKENGMELSSWVSIENNSGGSFKNAGLKLVAGDVHRAPKPAPKYLRERGNVMMADTAAMGGFEERGMFEYHLYDLGRTTDIMNNEVKQIALFDPTNVKAEKRYIYDSRKNDDKVAVSMEFENSGKSGLGMALPAGVVRVYKRDSDGEMEFVGEDKIDHTPKNEKVRATLGYAFDIVVERKIMENRRLSDRVHEQTVEIALRNRKEEDVTVTVVEHFYGDWTIREESHGHVKKDATTAEFTIDIPADGETKITYTVLVK